MIEDLQRFLDEEMNALNNRSVPEFEGYSPIEMNYILYNPFTERSLVQLITRPDEDILKVPMVKQIRYLADMIREMGEVKLTQKGHLPTKMVTELSGQNILLNEDRFSSRKKLFRESDSYSTILTRFIMELSGIIKKRYNKLSLTQKGEKLLSENNLLLKTILEVYCNRFNWAYFDGYGENRIGQFGFAFTLILLSKYGDKKRLDNFYADKYINAFPDLILQAPLPDFGYRLDAERCYSTRSFDRFLKLFGLVEIEQERWDSPKHVWKTELFDKLFKILPPGYSRRN